LVSICLPSLNTRPFLPQRMESLLAQTLTDWELIVCDSYSADGSWEYFQTFRGDRRVRLYQVPREGIYAGWNECLRRVTGRYVYIATSDDTAHPRLLESLVAVLENHPDIAQATCNLTLIDEHGGRVAVGDMRRDIMGDWLDRDHRRCGLTEFVATCVAHSSCRSLTAVVFRKTLLDKTGLFPTTKGSIADYEWCLRSYLATDSLHIAQDLATWRIHTAQATQNINSRKTDPFFLTMIEDVLRDCSAKLPPALRTPAARDRLLWPKRVLAFNSQQLYAGFFLTEPLATLRRLPRAWKISPALTVRAALHGFRWRTRYRVDHAAYFRKLCADYALPPLCSPP
jgi:glycosyltransferase involved in cell wall biosynthesis